MTLPLECGGSPPLLKALASQRTPNRLAALARIARDLGADDLSRDAAAELARLEALSRESSSLLEQDSPSS